MLLPHVARPRLFPADRYATAAELRHALEVERVDRHGFTKGELERGKTDLVRFCSERLPKYMVPDIFDFSDSLPKTSTGKIDRQQLKAVDRGN